MLKEKKIVESYVLGMTWIEKNLEFAFLFKNS